MPSLCPKLESFIKVMHRRMAKNDQKFTKICFSRELSLKSGKLISMSFGPFLTLLDRITWKKLQKRAKNGIMKKNPFLKKNEKTQIFFLRWAINHPKIIKKSKFLCSITSHAPKTTEKNFHGHWDNIHEMKSRFLKKTPFLKKSRWG